MNERKQAEGGPMVSFVIPTLNRGWYVLRAVASCLRNASDSWNVEVVVVDSSSDDGSFEKLQVKYGKDKRVRLLQNPRESGPLKSWIEGVQAASGKYMTFVWSDDLISPLFLRALLPALQNGFLVSYGSEKYADVDDTLQFSESLSGPKLLDRQRLLERYYSLSRDGSLPKVVNPVCSLFRARLLHQWVDDAEGFCRATPLREDIMWRRAIGPDLMLYLRALAPGTPPVASFQTYTAQFSRHSGSITRNTETWDLRVGYWLAKRWFIENVCQNERRMFVGKLWGSAFVVGCALLVMAMFSRRCHPFFFDFLRELASFLTLAWRRGLLILGLPGVIAGSLYLLTRHLMRTPA